MDVLIVSFSTYLLLCLLIRWRQNDMMFPAPPASYTAKLADLQFIKTGDGERVAMQLRVPEQARAVVVYAHGNAVDIGQLQQRSAYLQQLGLAVCHFDYPGYGLSSGSPTEDGCYAALDAVVAALKRDQRSSGLPLIWYGRSIGSGPAIYGAGRHGGTALIIESGMRSAQRVLLPLRMFPWDCFDNQARIAHLQMPMLFIHGRNDRVIPFAHGQDLSSYAQDEQRCVWLDDYGHNDISLQIPEIDSALRTFIDDLSLAPQSTTR